MLSKNSSSLRAKAEVALLRAVRTYTFNTPIARGKHRAYMTALGICRRPPNGLIATSRDGREFSVDLATGMQSTLYFLGVYEPAITEIVREVIRRNGFTRFLDVGANFGWYTSLFSTFAGSEGQVHSFEPVPSVFENLQRNVKLLEDRTSVKINNVALGDRNDQVVINVFSGLATGHSSLSDQGRSDAVEFTCKMIRLDDYLLENNVGHVDLVKVDIEGAEMLFLNGAKALFVQERPPVIVMEMALNQTKNFGYYPGDLIDAIRGEADYKFYKIDELKTTLREIAGFAHDDIGANVLCVPMAIADSSVDGLLSGTGL